MAAITRLAAVGGRPAVKVHLDGSYWTTLPVALVSDHDLHVGLELTADQRARLEHDRDRAAALSYALRSLDFRMASRGQLRDRLVRKGHDEATIEQTLDRCAEIGALDDAVLVLSRARRLREAGHAVFSTRQRLRRLGFDDAAIATALAETYRDFDEEAEARRLLGARPSTAARRSRAHGFLARRGFSPQVAARVAADVSAAAGPTPAAADPLDLARQVERRYRDAATDPAVRRRAAAWLRRRGASPDQVRSILRASAR